MADETTPPDRKANRWKVTGKLPSTQTVVFLILAGFAVIVAAALIVLLLPDDAPPKSLVSIAEGVVKLGVLVGVVGVYPATYLAYLEFREKPQKERLKDDFRLLGLVKEQDLDETVQILYQTAYHPLQYIVFIVLITITTLLILGGFLASQELLNIGGDTSVTTATDQTLLNIARKPLPFITPEQARLVFFAFLGAYFFSIGEMIRRYNTFDLLPQVYSSILVRMVSAVLLVYVGATFILMPMEQSDALDDRARAITMRDDAMELRQVAIGSTVPLTNTSTATNTSVTASGLNNRPSATQTMEMLAEAIRLETAADLLAAQAQNAAGTSWMAAGLLLAFIIGAFPKYGLQWFSSIVTKAFSGFQMDPQSQRPLTHILGISPWHEARLIEMGLDDAQNLATTDIRKLLLTTQFDTQEIVSWIDQAILYVKVSDRIDIFRRVGITSFYELRAMVSRQEVARAKRAAEGGAAEEEIKDLRDAWNRLLILLGFSDEMDLKRLTDYSNYPNFAHISQYYYNTEMVVRQRALEGRNILIGDRNSLAKSIVIGGSDPHDQIDTLHWREEMERSQLLTSLNPEHTEPHIRLGFAYYWLNRPKEARESFEEARRIMPTLEDAYIGLGALALDTGVEAELEKKAEASDHYLEAVRNFTHALGINATLSEVYNNRGLAYMKLGYLDQARKDLDRALELNDDLNAAYLNRGSVYLAHTAFEDDMEKAFLHAERDLHITYILGNRSPTLWVSWGTALIGLGRFEEAIQKLSQAVLQNVEIARAYDRRGYAYMQLDPPRYYAQARKDLEKAIKNEKESFASAYANLGLLEAYGGNDKAAEVNYVEALKMDPSLTTTRYNLAESYLRQGELEKAESELKSVVSRASKGSKDFNLAMEALRQIWRQPRRTVGNGEPDQQDVVSISTSSSSVQSDAASAEAENSAQSDVSVQSNGNMQVDSLSASALIENNAQTGVSGQTVGAESDQAQNQDSGES